MTFDLSKLKISTKSIIAFLIGLGGLLQIPQVSAPVFEFMHLHPHWASVFAVLTGIITILHVPQVQAAFGYTATQTAPDGSTKTVEVTQTNTEPTK